MDLTETFAPSQAGGGTATEEKTTDYFDFVVSPPPHCTGTDGSVDEDSFLHRAGCRTTATSLGYLTTDGRLHHDGFIKETNNNTLTALPPVSTITGALGHHIAVSRTRCGLSSTGDPVDTLDHQSSGAGGQDCDYWVTDDTKEQTCNILLEDLNKYCWTTQAAAVNEPHTTGLLVQRRDSPLVGDSLILNRRDCGIDGRQNTDGAIYTLTILNSETNSMDGLDCCKSPAAGTTDSWSLRPSNHLDLDAILNMESSVSIGGGVVTDGSSTGDHNDREHERQQVVVTSNGNVTSAGSVERYTVTTGQYTTADDQQQQQQQTATFVTVKAEPGGDNNNDWKLSDRNSLDATGTVVTQQQVAESAAESLLRNALQGKLYPASALQGATARILSEAAAAAAGQQQDEPMQACADELLLSQLDVDSAYRAAELKNIASEVVESYCNLEPVCNVSATTVMYTLDPASGSLGTITLPADLANVGTVTVVTTAPPQPDVLHQDTRHAEAQPGATRPLTSTGRTKTPKKYVRRANRNSNNSTGAAGGGGAGGGSNGASSGGQAGSGTAGSPGSVQQQQRKERSLHYCSICSKGFKDKYSVNVHIRTHTGEKPFACSLCGKSFRQKAHLAKHYQTHVTQKSSVAAAQTVAQAAATPPPAAAAAPSTPAASAPASSNGPTSSSASSNAGSVASPAAAHAIELQQAVEQIQQLEQQQIEQQLEQQQLEQQLEQQQLEQQLEQQQQQLEQQIEQQMEQQIEQQMEQQTEPAAAVVVTSVDSPIVAEACNASS